MFLTRRAEQQSNTEQRAATMEWASEHCKKGVELDSFSASAHWTAAEHARELSDYSLAAEHFIRAAEVDPSKEGEGQFQAAQNLLHAVFESGRSSSSRRARAQVRRAVKSLIRSADVMCERCVRQATVCPCLRAPMREQVLSLMSAGVQYLPLLAKEEVVEAVAKELPDEEDGGKEL